MKIKHHPEAISGDPDFTFYCPGCKCDHGIWVRSKNGNSAIWSFNGNFDAPTFNPSLRIRWTRNNGGTPVDVLCHLFINYGKIQYLPDCTHELAGLTIEMEGK